MKKIALILILLLIMSILSSYTVNKTNGRSSVQKTTKIKFEYFYRVFATMEEKYMSKYPKI